MKRITAFLLAAMCVNAPAFELTLTPTEKAKCEAEGGCELVTIKQMRAALALAYRAGAKTCEVGV